MDRVKLTFNDNRFDIITHITSIEITENWISLKSKQFEDRDFLINDIKKINIF